MKQVEFLLPEAAQLMATAERTGRVSEILKDVGLFYEEDASRRIKRLIAALEPVIIMVMGCWGVGHRDRDVCHAADAGRYRDSIDRECL